MYSKVCVIFFIVFAFGSAQTGQNADFSDLFKNPSMQQMFLNYLTQQGYASQAPNTPSLVQVQNGVNQNSPSVSNNGNQVTRIPGKPVNPSVNVNNNNGDLSSLLNLINNVPSQNNEQVVVPTQSVPKTVNTEANVRPNQAVTQELIPGNRVVESTALPNLFENGMSNLATQNVVLREPQTVVAVPTSPSFQPNIFQNWPNPPVQNNVPSTVVPSLPEIPVITAPTPAQVNNNLRAGLVPNIFQNVPNPVPIPNNVPQNVVPSLPGVPVIPVNNAGASFLPNIFQNGPNPVPVPNNVPQNVVPTLPGVPVIPVNNAGAGFFPNVFQNVPNPIPVQSNVPQNVVPTLPGVPVIPVNNAGASFLPNVFQNMPNPVPVQNNVVPNVPGVPVITARAPEPVNNGGAGFLPNVFQNVPNLVPVRNNFPQYVVPNFPVVPNNNGGANFLPNIFVPTPVPILNNQPNQGFFATPTNEPTVVENIIPQAPGATVSAIPSGVTYVPDEVARHQAVNAKYQFANVIDDNLTGLFMMREEARNGLKVVGKYAYDDGHVFRNVEYEADENGFRILKDQSVPSTKKASPNGIALVKSYQNGNVVDFQITKDDVQPTRRIGVAPVNNLLV